jgi:hypothetical protein
MPCDFLEVYNKSYIKDKANTGKKMSKFKVKFSQNIFYSPKLDHFEIPIEKKIEKSF